MPIKAEPRRRADARVVTIWAAISGKVGNSFVSNSGRIEISPISTSRLNHSIRLGHRPSGIQRDPAYNRSRTKKIIEAGVGPVQISTPSTLTRVRAQV